MRLLIYGLNYAPELTGVGKYTGEMAEAIAALGHEVRVVTAYPYYPAWKVEEGFSPWRYCRELIKGVKVWRCPLWVPPNPSGIKRVLHLLSFAVSSFPLSFWQGLSWRPDAVFVVEPTFLCVVAALFTAKASGAKAWLHIQDFEIDAGFDMGILPSSGFVRSLISLVEHRLMKCFDSVSTISERMLERLRIKEIPASKCVYFPNWVDTQTIHPLTGSNPLREELGLSPDTFVALYSGSMAEKQGLETLIAVANLLAADHPNIVLVLCGRGTAKKRLIELSKQLPNVRFLDLQPVERLNALLNLADVHLLPQLHSAADLVMPSKLKGMCASGRPIIATAEPGTQIAQVVQKCGIVVSPGNVTALAKAIAYLATDLEIRTLLGQQAYKYAVSHWEQKKVLGQFEQKLVELCFSPEPEIFDSASSPTRLKAVVKSSIAKLSRKRSKLRF